MTCSRSAVYFYGGIEVIWCICYVAFALYIMITTPTDVGEPQRTAIQFSVLHLMLVPTVIYAYEDGHALISFAFAASIMLDLNSVLQSSLHLWHDADLYTPFVMNMIISCFALAISIYAALWYMSVKLNNVKFRIQRKTNKNQMEGL